MANLFFWIWSNILITVFLINGLGFMVMWDAQSTATGSLLAAFVVGIATAGIWDDLKRKGY